MKHYQVYALGNALVDMEFSVSDEFLSQMNIQKGFMTLVDQEHQHRLLDALDHEQGKKACGGSAANSVIATQYFGGQCFYSCKVANDERGAFYLNNLTASGVHTLEHEREPGITGSCLVFITPDAERTMNTFLGITADVSTYEIEPKAIASAQFVYLEGYLVTSPTARAAAIQVSEIARTHDVKVAMTFSDPSMVTYFKEGINEMLGSGVDLLFCNREEAKVWANTDSLTDCIEALKKIARNFVITLGSQGALIFDGHSLIEIPSYPTQAIDTNGAGDLFAGAYLYGITSGHTPTQSGHLASLAAAKVVSQFGPRLRPEQHAEILQQWKINELA